MTTMQVRDDLDQTPPPDATEVNGHTDVEAVAAAPGRARKPKAESVPPAAGISVLEQLRELQERMESMKGSAIAELRTRRSELLSNLGDIDAQLEALGVTNQLTSPPAARLRKVAAAKPRAASSKRHRRTESEIRACVDSVVTLIKKNKDGLRAEQIRGQLGLEAKDMPKVLKTALASKQLKTKGRKRATTYFAKA